MVTGGTLRLLRDLVGPARAKMLLFSAGNISAGEALAQGLVERVAPDAALLSGALDLAGSFAKNAPLSIRMMKRGLSMAAGEASLSALMMFEVEACLACVGSAARERSLAEFAGRKEKA
jgi:enoyl-CoA hydratase